MANDLVFWLGDGVQPEADTIKHTEQDSKQSLVRYPSIYVQLFEEMVSAVLRHEPALFADEERFMFEKFAALDYPARYLLVRLSLRKVDKWHRLNSLKYKTELGDGISDAISELCMPFDANAGETGEPEHDEREVIDLTADDNDTTEMGSSNQVTPELQPDPEVEHVLHELAPNLTVFAYDERDMTFHELLTCLTLDELKSLAKQLKLKTTQNRSSLITALLVCATTQYTLDFPILTRSTPIPKYTLSSGEGSRTPINPLVKPLVQSRLSFPISKTLTAERNRIRKRKRNGMLGPPKQEERLREMAMKILGKCIRINPGLYRLLKRVDLVYFRSTDPTLTLLTPALLTRFKKRTYPAYTYTRTADIWRSREELVMYEEALELEASIDAMVGDEDRNKGGSSGGKLGSKTPAKGHEFVTPAAPGGQNEEEESDGRALGKEVQEGAEPEVPRRVSDARRVKALFETCIYPKWKELVQTKRIMVAEVEVRKDNVHSARAGLERFDCGFIYTRMIQKCAHALGVLKEYTRELQILDELLAQRFWRRGRRGKWYERRALILMVHCETRKEEQTSRRAMEGVAEGLLDEDTHMVYRPALVRRLTRLEKLLKLSPEMRHVSQGTSLKPEEVYVEGIRIRRRANSSVVDQMGLDEANNPIRGTVEIGNRAWGALSDMKGDNSVGGVPPGATTKWKVSDMTGKSVWRGRHSEEINVETFALQHYEKMGYKGFYSEGSITRTIFGLLFWDIIFASVPGAFETPYQSAPLDIADDAFYRARKDLIEARLRDIREGKAREILERVDGAQRERDTWCVGVRWDLFSRQDLAEIVECLGGEPLSIICKIFCEDYAQRSSGMPDLFIWNAIESNCKFVEVKGPGDTLQENQKIWIDVLLSAGVGVEVCKVVEHGKIPKKGHKQTVKSKGKGKGKSTTKKLVVESGGEPVVEIKEEDISPTQSRGTKRRRVDEELQVPFPAPNRRLFYNHAQTLSTTSPSSPVQKRLT